MVWRLKYRFRILKGEAGGNVREIIRQKQIEILEGHVQADHIHLAVSIPPKYSVSYAAGVD